VEKYGTARQAADDYIIRHMHFLCWLTKATDTHSEYVIFIAFPWQLWLHEHASLLHLYVRRRSCMYFDDTVQTAMYVTCLVCKQGSIQ
jgi:hypothetical protein